MLNSPFSLRGKVFFAAVVLSALAIEAGAADRAVVRGRIETIDPAKRQFTLHTRDGDVALTADGRSQFLLADKAATFDMLKRGQRVRVTFERQRAVNRLVLVRSPATSDADVIREARQAWRAASQYTFQKKADYEVQLRDALEDVDDRIDDLEGRIESATGEARRKLEQRLSNLNQKRSVLGQRLDKAASVGAEAWDDLKTGVSDAADELWRALEGDSPKR